MVGFWCSHTVRLLPNDAQNGAAASKTASTGYSHRPTSTRRLTGSTNARGNLSACVDDFILNVAGVDHGRRQQPSFDQQIIAAAVDLAGGVFSSAGGNDLAEELEVVLLVSHVEIQARVWWEVGRLRDPIVAQE
jgi:hypothetical protein